MYNVCSRTVNARIIRYATSTVPLTTPTPGNNTPHSPLTTARASARQFKSRSSNTIVNLEKRDWPLGGRRWQRQVVRKLPLLTKDHFKVLTAISKTIASFMSKDVSDAIVALSLCFMHVRTSFQQTLLEYVVAHTRARGFIFRRKYFYMHFFTQHYL